MTNPAPTFTLERLTRFHNWVLGRILDPNGNFICLTIEDRLRDAGEDKVKRETAITAGRYRLTFLDEKRPSKLWRKMKANRLTRPRWQTGKPFTFVPVIESEPGRDRADRHTLVRIHPGSNPGSSEGCPITALNVDVEGNTLGTSSKAFHTLHRVLSRSISVVWSCGLKSRTRRGRNGQHFTGSLRTGLPGRSVRCVSITNAFTRPYRMTRNTAPTAGLRSPR